ncbi:MAG TPA: hypothetical protein VMP12_06745 [Candidatus Sulfotelmatobacter sp.]|nr:hypothetical protein [Candidatus Sulfotelmatobacter sp.]
MADQQTCAEKLFLLGEMLNAANQYLLQCDEAARKDDAVMLDLAASELIPIRVRCAQLSQDLGAFDSKLRKRRQIS